MIADKEICITGKKVDKARAADFIVKALSLEGVTTVFGYPGGQIIPVFDALFDADNLRVILCRHEQALVHAADGYARATGRPGVCIVTSGPGATNTITGLATAHADSVPLVCITGQVQRQLIGKNSFQEANIIEITRSVTKRNFQVTKKEDLGKIISEAFITATSGRPGPVVVDIPKDIQMEEIDYEYHTLKKISDILNNQKCDFEMIIAVYNAIQASKRPLFFIGGGIKDIRAYKGMRHLIDITGIPAVHSLMGIGILPTVYEKNLGMIGMHGSIPANLAVSNCDLLIGIGVRFDDRATGLTQRFAPNATIVHIDIDPSSISKNINADISIIADAQEFIQLIIDYIRQNSLEIKIGDWYGEIAEYRNRERTLLKKYSMDKNLISNDDYLTSQQILKTVQSYFPDTIVSTEVGQHQMWSAQYMEFNNPRKWLTSGGQGAMGYGFPAGIGAQIALRESSSDERTLIIAGDGSLQMNIQELATCVQEELPVVIIILNNAYLGMVRQWQELFFDKRYSSTCTQSRMSCISSCASPGINCASIYPDFTAIARGYGLWSIQVTQDEQLHNALKKAKDIQGPVLIDCVIGREENVWPIVPQGKGNDQMLFYGEEV